MLNNYLGDTIAFIPLRGGSKSIPLKNIKKINERPLVYWVLDAVISCAEIDKIVISTDSKEISEVVDLYGSERIIVIDRSEEVSTDSASTESAMIEFTLAYQFKNIILVQATSPLLQKIDIENGLNKFHESNIDSVLSVVQQKRFIWKKCGNTAEAVNYVPLKRPRRQDFEGYFVENGAFYITSREKLLDTGCRISGNIGLVEMPEDTFFEIDEPSDWLIVENLLKRRSTSEDNLNKKIEKIRCVLSDCDGVLTDAGMYYTENGDELKKFNTKDGMGYQLLRENGYITGLITGEDSQLVKRRAAKLKMDVVYTSAKNKSEILDEICKDYKLEFEQIAYIGDDINDLDVIKAVGLGCVVSDAVASVRDAADYITKEKGGCGAFRELAELILHINGGLH